MTANASIIQAVLDAMQPGDTYTIGDLRDRLRGQGINDVQLRNALFMAYETQRTLRTGPRLKYRYYINPEPPPLRVGAVMPREVLSSNDLPAALAPTWPAPRVSTWPAPQAPRWSIAA